MPGELQKSTAASPLRLLILLAVTVFAIETLVMVGLPLLPPMPEAVSTLLDATLLVSFVFPVFYVAAFRPLTQNIAEREKAESVLRENEAHLRLTQEAAKVGTWDWNMVSNTIQCSENFIDLVGFREKTSAPSYEQWLECMHPADRDKAVADIDRAVHGDGFYYSEYRVIWPDGSVHWLESRGQVDQSPEGMSLVMRGALLECTARRQAQESLRYEKKFSETLVESLPGVFFRIDAEGRLLGSNKSLEVMVGKEALKSAQENVLNVVHESDREWVVGKIREGFESGFVQAEARLKLENGTAPYFYFVARIWEMEGEKFLLGAGVDISDRKHAEEAMKLATLVYENCSEAIIITDADNRIIAINPAFTRTTGYAAEDVIGRNPNILSSGRQDKNFYQGMWNTLTANGQWHGEIWNRRKNGEIYAESLTINTIYGDDGSVFRRVALFSDITEKKKSDDLIWHQANFDALTGLPNRRLFYDRLAQGISAARRKRSRLALFYLDLDGFKPVNDRYGHEAGDALLKAVAGRLTESVREMDTIARLGGDEFAVILGGIEGHMDIPAVAQKIIDNLSAPVVLGRSRQCQIGVSIGIALYPEGGTEIDSLMSAADNAMYASKEKGKNTYTFFNFSPSANKESWLTLSDTHLSGISEIDGQHQALVDELNQLNAAVRDNKPAENVMRLFEELLASACDHFVFEEKLMEQYDYPELAAHKREHENLLQQAAEFREKFSMGEELATLQFLKDWLMTHVFYADRRLASFILSAKN